VEKNVTNDEVLPEAKACNPSKLRPFQEFGGHHRCKQEARFFCVAGRGGGESETTAR
jgi:hypothetical protein